MKPFSISVFVLLYFISSVTYWNLTPDTSKLPDNQKLLVYLRVMYYLIQYGGFIFLALFVYKKIYVPLDLFSLKFFILYCVFKFVFFSLLLNKDLPTYVNCLNSKSTINKLSLLILVFTLAFNVINYDRYKKLLG